MHQARQGHPLGNQAVSERSGVGGIADGARLSREALGPSFRNDGRRYLNASDEIKSSYNDSRLYQQQHNSQRSGTGASIPTQQALWSSHRYPRARPAEWHHHHTSPETRRAPQPLWPSNRAPIHRTGANHLPNRISTTSHEWNMNTRIESRSTQDTLSSQRQWSNWHNKGSPPIQQEGFFGNRSIPTGASVPVVLTREKIASFNIKSKRSQEDSPPTISTSKRSKGLDMLDLLCQATLDVGPMQDNPTGCSCPKSKCVALYCDCFKAGRRCDEKSCGCIDCKNTVAESGADGARTRAIRSILARNPRAFLTAGVSAAEKRAPPGEIACNCIRSRCLKLYCSCFQNGRTCTESCTCVSCSNTEADVNGERTLAVQLCLEKRPDAFQIRVREPGNGCSCKNNRCVRKYCECFRSSLACTEKCTCRQCENRVCNGHITALY